MDYLNFDMIGTSMGYRSKLIACVRDDNPERVKDYLCAGFNSVNPLTPNAHPCWEVINEAIRYMISKGWVIKVKGWKHLGEQLILISPDNRYYHSSYKH